AAERMHAAAELWRQATGDSERTIGELLDADPLARQSLPRVLRDARHPRFTPDELLERVEQFAAESTEVIPAAAEALLREDLPEFARQVDRSQELAERLLHNQTAETIHLARAAREAGAVAASAFGAGFGGSVWAMLPEHLAQDFERRWRASYLASFPERAGDARFMHTRAA